MTLRLSFLCAATLALAADGPPINSPLPEYKSALKSNGAILVFTSTPRAPAADADAFTKLEVGLATEPLNPGLNITAPGIVVLDPSGRVKAKFFDPAQRYTPAAVLTRMFNWTPDAARADHAGRHIDLTSSASDDTVAAGDRITLVLDISLKPRMHVYAPGAEGYIPISWKLTDSPAVAAQEVDMPTPQTLYLPAIDEKAPVYEGRFRLLRDVTINKSPPTGDLVIEGSLKYQACDDRMCYIPETVPLHWSLHIEARDPTRASAVLQRK
jgi:hypothetical protein